MVLIYNKQQYSTLSVKEFYLNKQQLKLVFDILEVLEITPSLNRHMRLKWKRHWNH